MSPQFFGEKPQKISAKDKHIERAPLAVREERDFLSFDLFSVSLSLSLSVSLCLLSSERAAKASVVRLRFLFSFRTRERRGGESSTARERHQRRAGRRNRTTALLRLFLSVRRCSVYDGSKAIHRIHTHSRYVLRDHPDVFHSGTRCVLGFFSIFGVSRCVVSLSASSVARRRSEKQRSVSSSRAVCADLLSLFLSFSVSRDALADLSSLRIFFFFFLLVV